MKTIPNEEKKILSNICFISGFKNKKYYEIEPSRMVLLKSCWKNKNHKRKN
ncbi:hypothetical protein [Aliivibrio fischeri]|nr:hypothetical protein [Aliivibrio fischeri]